MQGGSCCPMGVVGLSPSSLVLAEPSCPCHAVPWDRGSPAASAPRVAQLWLRGTAGGVRGCTPCAWCRWFVWGQGCAPTSLRAQQWHRFPPAAPWPPQEVPEHPALQRGRGCPHQEGRGGTSATACACGPSLGTGLCGGLRRAASHHAVPRGSVLTPRAMSGAVPCRVAVPCHAVPGPALELPVAPRHARGSSPGATRSHHCTLSPHRGEPAGPAPPASHWVISAGRARKHR